LTPGRPVASLELVDTIFGERSSIAAGVGGDADEAGDDIKYVGEGVSGGEPNEGCAYNVDDTHPSCRWWR